MFIYPFKENLKNLLFSQLENNNTIELKKYQFPEGIKSKSEDYPDKVYAMHQKNGIVYPEIYKEITSLIADNVHWKWQEDTDEERPLQGVINLFSFSNVFHGMNYIVFSTKQYQSSVQFGANSWQLVTSNDSKEKLLQANYFDANSENGVYTCLLRKPNTEFHIPNNQDEYEKWFDVNLKDRERIFSVNISDLWLVSEEGFKFFKINLELHEYFDMLCLTKGSIFWQYLFIENASENTPDYELGYIMDMLIKLPKIFPNQNYQPLSEKFNKEFKKRLSRDSYQNQPFYKERIELLNF